MAVTYKKLTYNGSKIQVESAIRDGEGVTISTNYLKKNGIWACEFELGTSDTGTIAVSLSTVPSGVTPRIVQIYEKGTGTYTLIQTDAVLSVADNAWSCTVTKPTTGYSATWVVRISGWDSSVYADISTS